MPRTVVKAGATARLQRRLRPVSPRLPGRASGWSKKGWRRPDSQAFAEFGEAADLRWGGLGQVDLVGLFQTADRTGTLDIATSGIVRRSSDNMRPPHPP